MRAARYDRRGPARDVVVVGDVGKRSGGPDTPMPFPRVIPHSDGAGVIDAVGPGVDDRRLGQQVWCYGASPIGRSVPPPSTASSLTRSPFCCPMRPTPACSTKPPLDSIATAHEHVERGAKGRVLLTWR